MKKLYTILFLITLSNVCIKNTFAGSVSCLSKDLNHTNFATDTTAGDIVATKPDVARATNFSSHRVTAQIISLKLAVRNQSSEVIWVTQNENNIRFFILESSTDGINFISFAKIPSIGKVGSINNYRGIDDLPQNVKFYRLKLVDDLGIEHLSKTISVVKPH